MSKIADREIETIHYGTRSIKFSFIEAARKTLGITVFPDNRVLVSAPEGTGLELIKQKLYKKARWVIRKQDYFSQFFPKTPERQFLGGETHLYLGRQYRLKLIESDKNNVKLSGRYIYVFSPDLSPKHVQSLLNQWYKDRAFLKFPERLNLCIQDFHKYKLDFPELLIKDMRQRWGSLTPKKRIILNTELIKAPTLCIDYVITHELCHLLIPEHNKDFYSLLKKTMHDWEKRKNKLEKLLNY